MRIVLDLQSLQTESNNRGIGRYSFNLAEAMARETGGHELIIALNGALHETIEPVRGRFRDLVAPENIRVWSQLKPTAALDDANRWRAWSSELVREYALHELAPDVVHVTSLFEGLGDDAVISIGRLMPELPTAVTLYDLIPFLHAESYLADPIWRRWYLRRLGSLRAADLLLAISEHSRREAIDALSLDPDFVVAVQGDADTRFRPLSLAADTAGSLRERYGFRRPFIMYTGGIDFRKNVERLIEAYARLPQRVRQIHQLAVVCKIEELDRSRFVALSSRLGLRHDDVVLTGYVSDDDLVGLYNLCKLFVFPSLHEGFGLPVLEAMRCGAAVIGSDRTSIPEVIGRNDALFDPTSVDGMAAKIAQALIDDDFRSTLRGHAGTQAQKFSWSRSARTAFDAFEALHSRRRRRPLVRRESRKPRLAYVSPLPPERSGIATYSAELLPELARYYDIELVTELEGLEDPWLDANFPRRSATWVEAHAERYDRILYHFGNSAFHCHMFRLLRRCPGTVVLHDFFLGGVIHWMEAAGEEPGMFRPSLYRSHGWKALSTYASEGPDAAIRTYACNGEVIEGALGLIVHNSHSLKLAQEWIGSDGGQAVQYIAPPRGLPTHVDRSRARRQLGLPENDFVVCSFGILHERHKLTSRLLSSWLRSSLGHRPDCRLVFVGEDDNACKGTLWREIEKEDCSGRILITGYVTPDEYCHWLAAADVGVQLRAESRGETSRAVLDCLAYGLATIVNAHGAMTELPEKAVTFVPDDFADDDLAAALGRLHANSQWRDALGVQAQAYIRERHAPGVVGSRYAEAIERFASAHSLVARRRLVREVGFTAGREPETALELARLAETISENTRRQRPRQILVDVTRTAEFDLRTDIQRVVRAVLAELLDKPPLSYRVEPVYRPRNGDRYHYARSFGERFLDLEPLGMEDAPVHVDAGDVFLGLDFDPRLAEHGHAFLRYHAERGLRVIFMIYDLLFLQHPSWFPQEARSAFEAGLRRLTEIASEFVCISRTTADYLTDWLRATSPARRFHVGYFHLGADIESSRPSRGDGDAVVRMLKRIEGKTCFLMVGTVEPRKGYTQALTAMEGLWEQHEDVVLVIIGKQGWMTEHLAERLHVHPECGRRLFWFENASDEALDRIYGMASALLMASEGEGFGLPLIEAARRGLPIITRDLPVFREVAGAHAFYFSGTDSGQLVEALQEWRALNRRGAAPTVAGMPILTWAESSRRLLDVILSDEWYRIVTPEGAIHGGEPASCPVPAGREHAATVSVMLPEERVASDDM